MRSEDIVVDSRNASSLAGTLARSRLENLQEILVDFEKNIENYKLC